MKEIYIVIIEDRHTDTGFYPFSSSEKAISEAKRIAKEYCRYLGDYKEQDIEGWLFYAGYSCEGDNVRVVVANLDEEI